MPITIDVVSSNLHQPNQGEVYNIMWKSLSVTCDRTVVFSGSSGLLHQKNKTNRHDITEILLKVALNTFKQTNESCLWEDHLTKHCDLCHWFKTFKKLIFECIECSNDTGKSKQYQYTFTIHLLKWNNISIKKVNFIQNKCPWRRERWMSKWVIAV